VIVVASCLSHLRFFAVLNFDRVLKISSKSVRSSVVSPRLMLRTNLTMFSHLPNKNKLELLILVFIISLNRDPHRY
jgi:hypothetical protein